MSILISIATENHLLMMAFEPNSIEKKFTERNYVTNSETLGVLGNNKIKHKKENNVLIREIFDGNKYVKCSDKIVEMSKNQFSNSGGILVFSENNGLVNCNNIANRIRDVLITTVEDNVDNRESDIISHSIDLVIHYFDELKKENKIKYKGKYILYSNFSKTIVGQLGYNINGESSLEYKNDDETLLIIDKCIVDNIPYSYQISKIFDYEKHEKLCTVIHSVKDNNGRLVDLSDQTLSNKLLKEISIKYYYLNVIKQHFIKKELIQGWSGDLSVLNKKNPRMHFLGKRDNFFDFFDYPTKKFGCDNYTYNLYFKDKIIYFENSLIEMIENYLMNLLDEINIAEKNKEESKEINDSHKIVCLLFYLMNSLDEKKMYLFNFFKQFSSTELDKINYYCLCNYIKTKTFITNNKKYEYKFISVYDDVFLLNSNWSFNFHINESEHFIIAPLTPRHAFIFYEVSLNNKIENIIFNIDHMLFNALYLSVIEVANGGNPKNNFILFKNTVNVKNKIIKLMNTETGNFITNFEPKMKVSTLLNLNSDDYVRFYYHYNRLMFKAVYK